MHMYLVIAVQHDEKTNFASWVSLAGFCRQPIVTSGFAEKCSPDSAALRAVVEGLNHFSSIFRPEPGDSVSVLMPNNHLAERITSASRVAAHLHLSEDRHLWAEILNFKEKLPLKFCSSIAVRDSADLQQVFRGWLPA